MALTFHDFLHLFLRLYSLITTAIFYARIIN